MPVLDRFFGPTYADMRRMEAVLDVDVLERDDLQRRAAFVANSPGVGQSSEVSRLGLLPCHEVQLGLDQGVRR